MHAGRVFLSPQWYLGANAPVPEIRYLPELASRSGWTCLPTGKPARRRHSAGLRADLAALSGTTSDWWDTAPRDDAWWDAFFDAYSNLLYTYADIAQQNGVERTGDRPVGSFPGVAGQPETPADIETRWRVLVRNVRLHYAGKIAVEVPLTDAFPAVPQFFDEVDEFIVRVSGPVRPAGNNTRTR